MASETKTEDILIAVALDMDANVYCTDVWENAREEDVLQALREDTRFEDAVLPVTVGVVKVPVRVPEVDMSAAVSAVAKEAKDAQD